MTKKIEDLAGLKSAPELSRDLKELVDMMSLIKKVDCPSETESMISPIERSVSLSSKPAVSDSLSKDEILSGASMVKGDFFAIPKIIEK